ncbi:cytochrome P450 [Yinghuangia aomiensis]
MLGHCFVFRVLAIGPDAVGFRAGDLGTGIGTITSDGHTSVIGFSDTFPGGLGERMLLSTPGLLVPLPEGVDPVHAVFVEPLLVGEMSVRTADIPDRAPAVVLGTGQVGLGIIAALRRHGRHPIIAAEPTPPRRAAAEGAGADIVVDVTTRTWLDALADTGTTQAPTIFDTTGVPGMLARLFVEVPRGSHIVEVSGQYESDPIRTGLCGEEEPAPDVLRLRRPRRSPHRAQRLGRQRGRRPTVDHLPGRPHRSGPGIRRPQRTEQHHRHRRRTRPRVTQRMRRGDAASGSDHRRGCRRCRHARLTPGRRSEEPGRPGPTSCRQQFRHLANIEEPSMSSALEQPDLMNVLDIEGVDFAFDDIEDMHAILAELRARKPYAVVPYAGDRALLLLTHELVTAAFKDEESFPAAAFYVPATEAVMGHTLQCMGGEEHRINRALVAPSFRRKLMDGHVAGILEPLAHEIVDRFADRGSADLVAEFTHQYPIQVITRLLGLPVHDEERFQRWAYGLLDMNAHPEAAAQASAEFTAYVTATITERRAAPGADLLSNLATLQDDEGRSLSDEEILSFLRLLFPAGADTTYLGLGSALLALLTHPDQLELLLSDPAEHLPWAVEEALRWEPPVGMQPRVCPVAVKDWHGIDIPDATKLICGITAANRDPQVYPDPDRYDITRRAMATLTFGDGPHTCLGTFLAIAEMRVAIKVLLERLPNLRLADGAKVHMKGMMANALRGPDRLPVTFGR